MKKKKTTAQFFTLLSLKDKETEVLNKICTTGGMLEILHEHTE